jgi:DNA primase
MRRANATRARFAFLRNRLPTLSQYYQEQGLKLTGNGDWRNAICCFHDDTRPSLRIQIETGAFRCMVCGAHGSDVLAFHMQHHNLRFIDAAKALGAWEDGQGGAA